MPSNRREGAPALSRPLRCAGLGALAATAGLGLAGGFLVSRGRIALHLGWGRTLHPLGPFTVSFEAPREVVYEYLSAPYLGRMPATLAGKISILERSDTLVVAEHRTPLPAMDALTVEAVRFEPPERISFCLLAGPVPHVLEEFVLTPTGEGTTSTLTYRGELGADLWVLGRIYGARIVRPVWEAAVRSTLDQAKIAVEQRGAAHRRRKPSS